MPAALGISVVRDPQRSRAGLVWGRRGEDRRRTLSAGRGGWNRGGDAGLSGRSMAPVGGPSTGHARPAGPPMDTIRKCPLRALKKGHVRRRRRPGLDMPAAGREKWACPSEASAGTGPVHYLLRRMGMSVESRATCVNAAQPVRISPGRPGSSCSAPPERQPGQAPGPRGHRLCSWR